MVSTALQQQLDSLALLSEAERLRVDRQYGLMQEILRLGRVLMPTKGGTVKNDTPLRRIMKTYNVPSTRGGNPWGNVCRLVKAYSDTKYPGKDFSFIDGYARYLRHFDDRYVDTKNKPDVETYIATYKDPTLGSGLTGIAERSTYDNRYHLLANQDEIAPSPTGLCSDIDAALDGLREKIRSHANANGRFDAYYVRLMVGSINSLSRTADKNRAKTKP